MILVDENTFLFSLWEPFGVMYSTEQRIHANATAIHLDMKNIPPTLYLRSTIYQFAKIEKKQNGVVKRVLYTSVLEPSNWFVIWNR